MTTPPPAAGRGSADRARLAAGLRQARLQAGLGGIEAGRRAGMSQSKISKIERGFLLPSAEDVAALCQVYEIPGGEQRDLAALAAGLHEESSARIILARGVAETQRRIGQLEGSAALTRSFQPVMVIGLLQTAAYMRCVFTGAGLPAADAEDAIAARLERQRILEDPGRQFVMIMTEGALRWQAGSAAVMAGQADALIRAAQRPNVRLGIIAWTTPVHLFPRSGWHIYDTDAVIVATETATATMTAAADITTYQDLFAALEASASFGDQAAEHLTRISADYRQLQDQTHATSQSGSSG